VLANPSSMVTKAPRGYLDCLQVGPMAVVADILERDQEELTDTFYFKDFL